MRKTLFAALAAATLLAACKPSDQSAGSGGKATIAPAVAEANAISGTVVLREPIPVNAGAKLHVRLIDIAAPDAAVAEKTIEVSGTPPYSFSLDFDRSRITADRTYVVDATLTDGDRRFLPTLNSPVLTKGAGATAQVSLKPEPTPTEKLKETFAALEAKLGATSMKPVNGKFTTDKTSVAWDGFVESGKVRFVRVTTDFDAGGRSSVHYAFHEEKDGNGVMVVREKKAVIVGWDKDGKLLWNEKTSGGSADDKAVAAMRDEALRVQKMAQEKYEAEHKR